MHGLQLSATWDPRSSFVVPQHEPCQRGFGIETWRHPRLEAVTLPDPTPGLNQVVVQTEICGICGSDTHSIETDDSGYVCFSGVMRLPCILGHEFAGRVVAVGPKVTTLSEGDLVTAESILYCGYCESCRRGMFNQCQYLEMLGFTTNGAFADCVCLHERHLWRLDSIAIATGSEITALEWGAMIEPIACAYNGIWITAGGMKPGAFVAIYGCGPIGLGAILLCRAAGAARIVAFDNIPERVALARLCGADVVWEIPSLEAREISAADIVLEATGGWGADLHIEAAGDGVHTFPEITASLAPGATVLYLGRTGGRIPVAMDPLVSNAARVVGSRGHAGGGCYPNLLRMMASGVLDPGRMITARMPIVQAEQALNRSRSRIDGKILLVRD